MLFFCFPTGGWVFFGGFGLCWGMFGFVALFGCWLRLGFGVGSRVGLGLALLGLTLLVVVNSGFISLSLLIIERNLGLYVERFVDY